MLKKILTSSLIIGSVALLFSGCNDFDGKYHKVVEFDATKNLIVIDYRSDKIAYGYFKQEIEDYCASKNRVASVNSIKPISKTTERVTFTCVIDDGKI
jgi:hypothetical protein